MGSLMQSDKTMRAVQYDQFGDIDVLEVRSIKLPVLEANQVLIKVKTAGINPGENGVRGGMFKEIWPSTFPSGQGTDFAGVVEQVGKNVANITVGDSVVSQTQHRSAQAEYVAVDASDVVLKPDNVAWEIAGGLYVAGMTAYAGIDAVDVRSGDNIVITGAAGGVGSIAVQLARDIGANVYGVAGSHDADWLRSRDVTPVDYSGDVKNQIESACGTPDAFLDFSGKEYVKMAIELGVETSRINTAIDFEAAKEYGVLTKGASDIGSTKLLNDLVQKISDGIVAVPIAKTFPLQDVQRAYQYLANNHHRGKIVLTVD